MPPENNNENIRDLLEDAYEEAATDDTTTAPEPVEPARPEADPEPETGGPVRDEHGRFAPKDDFKLAQPGDEPGKGVEPKPTDPATAEAPPAAEELKAPQSFSPTAREHWATLPQEVKADIVRRERDHERGLQESAQARGFMDAFERVVRPFEGHIIAEGSNPLQAFHNLMTIGARLRSDPPAGKAQVVADLITHYGVDVRALDSLLAGAPLPPQAQQQPATDPRVDQLLFERQQMQQALAQRQNTEVQSEITTFKQGKEYFEDVRDIMADLVEVAARQGKTLSLDDAYKRACAIHPEVSTILDKKRQAAAGHDASEAAKRAKRAAVSIRGTTPEVGGATGEESETVRAALEQAFASARS